MRGTWAPKGQTPVLRHRFSWTRLSMSGALAHRPEQSEAALVFQIKEALSEAASSYRRSAGQQLAGLRSDIEASSERLAEIKSVAQDLGGRQRRGQH